MMWCLIPEGVALGILGGGVPPGIPNPDPTSHPKKSFSTPVLRPAGGHKTQHTCSHFLTEILSSLLR